MWSIQQCLICDTLHIDGLVQERRNSSASAMELRVFALTYRYIIGLFGETAYILHIEELIGNKNLIWIYVALIRKPWQRCGREYFYEQVLHFISHYNYHQMNNHKERKEFVKGCTWLVLYSITDYCHHSQHNLLYLVVLTYQSCSAFRNTKLLSQIIPAVGNFIRRLSLPHNQHNYADSLYYNTSRLTRKIRFYWVNILLIFSQGGLFCSRFKLPSTY